jgi:hypothetical protein
MFFIYHSRSRVRRITRELGVSAWYANNNVYVRRNKELSKYINWGCGELPVFPAEISDVNDGEILNRDISFALSKKLSLTAFREAEIRCPPLFNTVEEAMRWEHGWLGRRDGLSGGRGISIFEKGQEPLQAAEFDFMVGIIPKIAEYRIHVGKLPDGVFTILATQQKMGVRESGRIINNHASGLIYSAQELRLSTEGRVRANNMAISAIQACGLDFGAVDLMQSADHKLYVLEVNTAPGCTSTPIYQTYLNYFRKYVEISS